MKKVILGLVACMMVSLSSVVFSSCKESEEIATREYQLSLRVYDKGNLPEELVAIMDGALAQKTQKVTVAAGTEQACLTKAKEDAIAALNQQPEVKEMIKEFTFTVRLSLSTVGTTDDKYKIDVTYKNGEAS